MRTRVLVAATAFAAVGIITGCERTTPGTVALTTEPGLSIATTSSRPTTTSPRSTTPRSSTPRTTPRNGPPSDALNITCEEYVDLTPDEQDAVIEEIISQSDSVFPPDQQEVAKIIVDGTCSFLPDTVVSELLLGTPP